ncbi:multi-copy leucine-rich repeat protein, putative, partial [Bodo saltans]
CIIAALRRVLHWKGPMFIAIDDFNIKITGWDKLTEQTLVRNGTQPRLRPNENDVPEALENICVQLLDSTLPLMKGSERPTSHETVMKYAVFERYIAVSVCKTADLAALSWAGRPLIYQPVTMLSAKDAAWHLTTVKPKAYSTQLHESFARMFVGKRK